MAAPQIEAIHPNDNSDGVPIGADVEITFDQGIDLRSGKANVVIYGADFDKTSGPDSAAWITKKGNNPYFLKSPGFSGTVECDYEVVYVDNDGNLVDTGDLLTREQEVAGDGVNPYRHKLIVKPKDLLAPDTEYKVYIVGDSEGGSSKGISSRTVYDVAKSNADATGDLKVYSGYKGDGDDKVFIKITNAGNIGIAEYKWWYESAGEASAKLGKTTSRRYRRLEDGLQVRFTGSAFILNDVYSFNVYAPVLLEDSYTFSFDTGTGSIIEVPEEASTSIIGSEISLVSDEHFLEVVDMDPDDGSTHLPLSTNTIRIKFSEKIDPATITEETVSVFTYPVKGRYRNADMKELVRSAFLDPNDPTILILEI